MAYTTKKNEKIEIYLNSKIVSYENHFESFNVKKNKLEDKKEIICLVYRLGSKWQPLNLNECNDGSKFTSINQAINQAKEYINICNKLYLVD
jgi:hypothetical protein